MLGRSIYDLASPDVSQMIGREGMVVMPFGSIEQHGPHLPCGTDTMAADLVAAELAERLDAIVVPVGPYGVTPIHAGHPGTISLRRDVFEAYLANVCQEMVVMGARTFVFVNWHEGNIASLDAVATDLQAREDVLVVTAHACYTAQRIYAPAGGELTHGGGIETLAVLAHDPDLFHAGRVSEPTRPEGAEELDAMRRSREVYGYITDVTEIADEGWYGNPAWADEERAGQFAATVADEIATTVKSILKMRETRVVTVVGPDELNFRDFPGRSTADPFKMAGQGASTVRQVVIEHVPTRSPHLHPQSEEIVYVVAGHGRVWLDGVVHPVGPGSWYRIPAGTPHATMADPDERMSLVCFFPHDDFAGNIEELDLLLDVDEEENHE